MSGMADTASEVLKKTGYFVMQYGYTGYFWLVKTAKVQLQKCKRCGSRKKLEKACSTLGAEIYSLHKQGEGDWKATASVQQQLRQVEEAESLQFLVDEAIEAVLAEYRNRKEEIRDKYAAKRSQVGGPGTDES